MLLKENKFAEAKALDQVVCGGVHYAARFDATATCTKCGQLDSLDHHFYRCPFIETLEKEDPGGILTRTRWMAKSDRCHRPELDLECLWLRSMVPYKAWAKEDEGEEFVPPPDIQLGDFEGIVTQTGKAWTDGAGAE